MPTIEHNPQKSWRPKQCVITSNDDIKKSTFLLPFLEKQADICDIPSNHNINNNKDLVTKMISLQETMSFLTNTVNKSLERLQNTIIETNAVLHDRINAIEDIQAEALSIVKSIKKETAKEDDDNKEVEESNKVDDEIEYDTECPEEYDNVIIDIDIKWNISKRAILTLPNGLRLAKSTLPGAGLGVFTDQLIPVDTYMGPYEGEIIYNEDDLFNDGEYAFAVSKKIIVVTFAVLLLKLAPILLADPPN
ncbi:unnamed protein product [Owenia fusiformis]|uniref:Uncharacterized protein n=1 Tax=Owenia fusiformis TaxID=6347 RepID=A0A8S4NKE2_OWEFU|nr:unnamed protein product [Owenia fusiformis]